MQYVGLTRKICWTGACAVAAAGLLLPASAGAQAVGSVEETPVEKTTVEETAVVTLDPTDFDPITITDTEVRLMRTMVRGEVYSATLVNRGAESRLANAEVDHDTAEAELEAAVEQLETTEQRIGAAAIHGYLADGEVGDAAMFTLDADTDLTRASETAERLFQRRIEAREALEVATDAEEEAARALRVAISRKARAEAALAEADENMETFSDLEDEQREAAERADDAAAALSDEVELRSVAGTITVNADIEDAIDELIAAARADGINLGGGGYRTIESQIALRLSHCGGSVPSGIAVPGADASAEERAAYDAAVAAHRQRVIYEVPSSSCSPPTATPGNSEHQQGLAVDFTLDGAILTRWSDGFTWLTEHAEEYGLINLPSEAWHWSTTGN